ncbi:MAG: hypothetical protein P1P63_00160 [Treponemataceae bacterium]
MRRKSRKRSFASPAAHVSVTVFSEEAAGVLSEILIKGLTVV